MGNIDNNGMFVPISPYVAGRPIDDPKNFFGRQDVFEWIRLNIERHALVIHGQRRIGKTSVLNQLQHSSYLPDRYIPVTYILQGHISDTLELFLYGLASEITRVIHTRGFSLPAPDRNLFEQDPDYFERDFLRQISSRLPNHILIICLDEFDTLEGAMPRDQRGHTLADCIRSMLNNRSIRFIFSIGSSGRRLESMRANFTELLRFALYKQINFLSKNEAFRLMAEPAAEWLQFDREAMDEIYALTSGHPYYIQLICNELFSRYQKTGRGQVTVADVQAMQEDVIERGKVNLKIIWDEADGLEKWVMTGVANLEPARRTAGDLAAFMAEHGIQAPVEAVTSALISLIEKEVLNASHGFVIRLFELWLCKNWPVEMVLEKVGQPVIDEKTYLNRSPRPQPFHRKLALPQPARRLPRLAWFGAGGLLLLAAGLVAWLALDPQFPSPGPFAPTLTLAVSQPPVASATSPGIAPSALPTQPTPPAPLPPPTATPLFGQYPAIDVQNASSVRELATWGKGRLSRVDLSPNGKLMALATSIGIYIYNFDPNETFSQQEPAHFIKTDNFVDQVVFSPNSQLLASSDRSNEVNVWTVSNWGLLRTYYSQCSWYPNCVAFSPDSATLAFSISDHVIQLQDINEVEKPQTLSGHTGNIQCIAFSQDGHYIASGADDNTVRLWDRASGKLLKTLSKDQAQFSDALAFSPDSQLLVTVTNYNNTLKLWQIPSGQLLKTLQGHWDPVNSVTFSNDGKTLASSSTDATIRLWDPASGDTLRTMYNHTDNVLNAVFSPDGQNLVSVSDDGTAWLWDANSGLQKGKIAGFTREYYALAFSPDGRMLAAGSEDHAIHLFDPATGDIETPLVAHTYSVRGLAFSPDGRYLASASDDKTARIWDLKTNATINSLFGHMGGVQSVAFSPLGSLVATGAYDNTVRLWNITSGESTALLEGHTDTVNAVTFSPDGKLLASGSMDQTIRIWDVTTGEFKYSLTIPNHAVTALAFSPDGRLLASASQDNTIRIWNLEKREAVLTLRGHSSWVTCVSFSPDGSLLASGSSDRSVRLWEVATGSLLRTLVGHTSTVEGVAFSPQRGVLASTATDGTVRLWAVLP